MVTPAAVLALLLSLPRPAVPADETAAEYEARVAVIAEAIALETRSVDEAAAVAVIVYAESALRRDVHSGETLGDGGRAICLAQVHPHARNWSELAGTHLAATRRCVAAGLRVLRHGVAVCGRGTTGTRRMALGLQAYASGHCGAPSAESVRRAGAWARVANSLRVATASERAGGAR